MHEEIVDERHALALGAPGIVTLSSCSESDRRVLLNESAWSMIRALHGAEQTVAPVAKGERTATT